MSSPLSRLAHLLLFQQIHLSSNTLGSAELGSGYHSGILDDTSVEGQSFIQAELLLNTTISNAVGLYAVSMLYIY